MGSQRVILAIDQGTTSSRAMLFDHTGQPCFSAQAPILCEFPRHGWVEQCPESLWQGVLDVCQQALNEAAKHGWKVAGIGITNQRETTLVWDRVTGEAVYPAINWQDRRTETACKQLAQQGMAGEVHRRTGLPLDPYFSASKLRWILDHITNGQQRAQAGELAFGTVDCYLIWRLTRGEQHLTDITNASRTALYNINSRAWDPWLLQLFSIPKALLPEVRDNVADFGHSHSAVLGSRLPIVAVAGDQQAAAIGCGCINSGDLKSTYGTGCFMLANTGDKAIFDDGGLLTTIAFSAYGRVHYALEGSLFMAGATIQWLRDELKILELASDSEALAKGARDTPGLYLIPAFVGLGVPHWRAEVRASIFGLHRDTGRAELTRAALESVAFQTMDLLDAMGAKGIRVSLLRVDGGMVENRWFCQRLADISQHRVQRAEVAESTARGVAMLASLAVNQQQELSALCSQWRYDSEYAPSETKERHQALLKGWHKALNATLSYYEP